MTFESVGPGGWRRMAFESVEAGAVVGPAATPGFAGGGR